MHGNLQSQGLSTEGIPYVSGSEGFTVENVTKVMLETCFNYLV